MTERPPCNCGVSKGLRGNHESECARAYLRSGSRMDPDLIEKDSDLLFRALNEHLTDEQQEFAIRLEDKLRWRPLTSPERQKLQELVSAVSG